MDWTLWHSHGEPQDMWRTTEQQSSEIYIVQPITCTVESSVKPTIRLSNVRGPGLSPTGGVHCDADYPNWGSITI
jgi:hypothetical protein